MPKFKPGDRVRALKTVTSGGFTLGNVYTVKNIFKGAVYIEIDDQGSRENCWHEQFFEFVAQESDLEALVRKANEGEKAAKEIQEKYSGQVRRELDIDGPYASVKFSILPKTKKFKVAKWDAEICENDVKIGCETFNKGQLKCTLTKLTKENCSESNGFLANRDGIAYQGHRISWDQAEALLKELEK